MFWYKQIAANTFFQIVARVISSGASFLITLLVARHFGLVGYGDFSKVTSFVTLFYLFIDFGFNPVFLQKDEAKVRFKDLLYLRLLFASVVTGIVFLITFILPYNPQAHIGFSPEVRLGIILFSFTII